MYLRLLLLCAAYSLASAMITPAIALSQKNDQSPEHSQPKGLIVLLEKSEVTVTFRQMGVSADARFKKVDIDLKFDPAAPQRARATVLIDTASFDLGAGAEEYNEEVRSADWFDTARFPNATFRSLQAKPVVDNKFDVIGTLTIKGISQEVVTRFELKESMDNWVLLGQLAIKRLAFRIGDGDWKDTSIVEDEVIVKFRIVTAAP